MRPLVSAALLVSLAACQPDGAVGPEAGSFFTVKDPSLTNRFLHVAHADSGEALEARRARFADGTVAAMQVTLRTVGQTSSWREQHAALRRFLADAHPDDAVQAQREIVIASSYPPGHLINDDPLTPEKQGAIAYYATLLIENGQLGGDKATKALDRLEGYWPDAKLVEARQLVAAPR